MTDTKIKTKDMMIFFRQFAVIHRASVSEINTLRMIEEQIENSRLKAAVSEMVTEMGKGAGLYKAMESCGVFPEPFTAMVQQADSKGDIDDVFEKMAQLCERKERIGKLVERARIYPKIVLILAIGIILSVLLFVLPKFMSMFDSMEIAIPKMTDFLFGISGVLRRYGYVILLIIILITIGVKLYLRTVNGEINIAKLKRKIPGLSKYNSIVASAVFSRMMSTLISTGIPVGMAINITAGQIHDKLYEMTLRKIAEQIEGGQSLSKAISACGLFQPLISQMISVGEETGNLENILADMADYFEAETIDRSERYMSIAEPVTIVVLAVIVGIIVVSMLEPILAVYDMIGRM